MLFDLPSHSPIGARLRAWHEKHRLPTMFGLREFADAGGLMAYGPNLADAWQARRHVCGQDSQGAKPGELPVEQPTKFELVINLKDGKGAGADDSAIAAAASGGGDSVM